MHISEYFSLPISGHADIEFIDIHIDDDTRLYIDPYIIQALPINICNKAHDAINSFFSEIFCACQRHDIKRLRELFSHAGEPNETNLGMKSKSDFGKGSTAIKLTELFVRFYRMVSQNPYVTDNLLALCMYIENFDKDKMSDLVTNIIRNLLYQFTVEQCEKWKIALGSSPIRIGYYWDSDELNWRELYGKPLLVNSKSILLVPKSIVRQRYVFNVECYLKQYVLKALQKQHQEQNSDMCKTKELKDGKKIIVPPTIDELYKQEIHGVVHKNYAITHSSYKKEHETLFVEDMIKRIQMGYGLKTDENLDSIVYKPKRAS